MDTSVIIVTGLSGAGKTTIANALNESLVQTAVVLDGDVIRQGICKGLGFSKEDRDENIRRVSWAAKHVADAGGVAIVACISPYAEAREQARQVIGPSRFLGVYVRASLEECERRDPKGLYEKARKGKIKGFTGIDDPFEEPADYLVVDTELFGVERCVEMIVEAGEERGLL